MKSRGFSLIELIVVISIVVMLAALMLPVSRRARNQARAVVCQSNIKQLVLEFQQYETEHEALPYGFTFTFAPPRPGWYTGSLKINAPGWYWPNFIKTVRHRGNRDLKILECPAKHLDDYILQRDIFCGNYGVNRSICRSGAEISGKYEDFTGPQVSTSTIRHPGNTLLLVDSGYTLICWWQARDDPLMELEDDMIADTAYIPGMTINQERELWPAQKNDAIGGRHPDKTVNVGFVDGHVASKKADDLLVEKADDETYTNRSPLWEPN